MQTRGNQIVASVAQPTLNTSEAGLDKEICSDTWLKIQYGHHHRCWGWSRSLVLGQNSQRLKWCSIVHVTKHLRRDPNSRRR